MAPAALLWVCLSAAPPGAWGEMFERAGLNAAEARVDLDRMALYGGGAYRLPLFDVLMRNPFDVPALGRIVGEGFVNDANGIAPSLVRAAQQASLGVRRGLVDPVPEALRKQLGERPLATALARVRAAGGAVTGTPYQDPAIDDLPVSFQQDLALLLLALETVIRARQVAFADAPAAGMAAHIGDLKRFAVAGEEGAGAESEAHERRLDRLVAGLDLFALTAAATDLALVLDDVRPRLAALDLTAVTTRRFTTPVGDVVIGGAGPDTYDGPAPLLILECGGDDLYHAGAGAGSADRPVSVILDLAGNDRYESTESVCWGAGVGGVAMLIDPAGNDRYVGTDATQGCGVGGVGVLWDGGGDDHYEGRVHAQGSGSFGVGLLVDLAGDDHYTCLHRSQGYGYSQGAGVLVDGSGEDVYVAANEPLTFASPQSGQHNASLSQGFGFGRRADYTNGHSLCGGAGWLVDGGGKDRYSCGVFGQGGGYWYGVGMLVDLGGDDSYQGVWYVQGAAAHFAVGGLYDAGGDDRYEATHHMAQGAGHDFSLGFLTEVAGNDTYLAPSLALGAGNANGVGFFWDLAGNDRYEAKEGVNLGRATTAPAAQLLGSPRRMIPTLGLFLDEGGADTYTREGCGDGQFWAQAKDETAAAGYGWDR